MDIYDEGRKPHENLEYEDNMQNVTVNWIPKVNNEGLYEKPLDILNSDLEEHIVDGDQMNVTMSDEPAQVPVTTIDISSKPVTPKKDWPGNRCYLYGLTSEYYPIVYRYIQKTSLNIGTIKKVMTDIRDDYPNVVSIYIVDNSKDIHEAFNRARTKYRPSEDRAIFKCMLEDKGIVLFERSKEA